MPPAGGRFGPQILTNSYAQLQHAQMQHASNHQAPPSAGLPPPSFNSHQGFPQSAQNLSLNAFATNATNNLAAGFRGGGGGGGLGGGGTGLASHAAVMAFGHGAALQQQQQLQQSREGGRRGSNTGNPKSKSRIRDVWKGNLQQEFHVLRELIEKYPYIAMDTEFPGIVIRPMTYFNDKADYHYQTIRANVDSLLMIQLGISLFSVEGELPPAQSSLYNETNYRSSPYQQVNLVPCPYSWQFNFKFSLEDDMYSQESIDFLQAAGMNLELNQAEGIDPKKFGALMMSSGLVQEDDVHWLSFHSAYDFAYLFKILFPIPMPSTEAEYRTLLNIFFPSMYDIKYIMKFALRDAQQGASNNYSATAQSILNHFNNKASLQDLADELSVKRIGTAHQAGSDALLTGRCFFDMKKAIFNNAIDPSKYRGMIWGLDLFQSSSSSRGPDGMSTPNLNGATIYHTNGTPSTPGQSLSVGTHSTPGPTSQSSNGGAGVNMGPGGGGGVFGRFGYARANA
ncbi:hypothetical protein MMC25_008056 [Agyrium rufum]|nr:hypothetical protein [Agyrium rufum]